MNNEQKNNAGTSASMDTKPLIVCSVCHAVNSIRSNKVEIAVGDKQGSVAAVIFNYCDECGHRHQVDWFD